MYAIRRFIRLIKTAQPEANKLTFLSLIVLLLKIVILNPIPAFSFTVYGIGVVLENILISIIASYAFYLFVVHLKEYTDKATIQPYIARHVTRVVGDCQNQLREISSASGTNISLANVSITSITDAFTRIAPYSNVPLIISTSGSYANWFEYFAYHRNRTRESISRVLAQILYVDAQLVNLLIEVDDCSHFNLLEHLLNMPVRNEDLSAFASTFSDYCQLCRRLNSYRERHLL